MALAAALLNRLQRPELHEALEKCCASPKWVEGMIAARPFVDDANVAAAAVRIWEHLEPNEWLAAFAAHPQIGALPTLGDRFAVARTWAAEEQAGAKAASLSTVERLALLNCTYLERFGYIFIVCATGKSAEEMLAMLEARLHNEPAAEIQVAAAEQLKITLLRLRKLTA